MSRRQSRQPRPRFTEPDILEAKAKLVDVVAAVVTLKKRGRRLWGGCPFHRETSPSFTVLPEDGFYHCHGCGAHGSAIDFVMEIRGLSFPEAMTDLLGRGPDAELSEEEKRARDAAAERQRQAERERAETRAREDRAAIARAGEIVRACQGQPLDLVEAYLRGRGIVPAAFGGLPRRVIRFSPDQPYWHEPDGADKPVVVHAGPAMVAVMQGPDGRGKAAHITWLAADGSGKARIPDPDTPGGFLTAKKMRGRAEGTAVRLRAPSVPVLCIAEGIETGFSILQAVHDLGYGVWVAGSLTWLGGGWTGRGAPHPEKPGARLPGTNPDPDRPGLVAPPGIETVLVCSDGDSGDPHSAGALVQLALNKFRGMGLKAAEVPAPKGMDHNDWGKLR